MKMQPEENLSTHGRGRAPWRVSLLVAGLVVLLSAGSAVAHQADLSKFADALANLRSEVEALSSEVEMKKEEQRTRVRALSQQRTDLELQLEREERRVQQLEAATEKQREKVAAEEESADALRPAAKRSIDKIRGAIRDGVPFKKQARLDELEKLEQQLDAGMLSPQKASGRLWQFAEDELRLARENGLYRQTIVLDGEEMLVDVARVGMVGLYFLTDDGRVGYPTRSNGSWDYRVVRDKEEKERIHTLFDSFKKQIRTGYFALPNAFPKKVEDAEGATNRGGAR